MVIETQEYRMSESKDHSLQPDVFLDWWPKLLNTEMVSFQLPSFPQDINLRNWIGKRIVPMAGFLWLLMSRHQQKHPVFFNQGKGNLCATRFTLRHLGVIQRKHLLHFMTQCKCSYSWDECTHGNGMTPPHEICFFMGRRMKRFSWLVDFVLNGESKK